MAYILDDDGRALVADVKNFCDKEVKEQCKAYDESGEWPKEIYDKAIELGYQMLEVPEEYGGLGLPGETILAMYEEMAWADAGFAVTMAASNLALKPILIAGSEILRSSLQRRTRSFRSYRAQRRFRPRSWKDISRKGRRRLHP